MCPTPRSETTAAGELPAAARRVRSLLHRLGYRFRLRGADLPGCPDVVLPRWRLVIFVVDCRLLPHADCPHRAASLPAAAGAEAQRLAQAEADLERQGWRTLRVPACAAADPESLGLRLDIAVQERLLAAVCTPPEMS